MNVFDRTIDALRYDFMLNEMSVKEISSKDFINFIKKHEYEKALDNYIKAGGAIGGRAQPRRTMTAWRGYVEKKDPRYEGITADDIDKFEKLLMDAHAARKEEEKTGKSISAKEPEVEEPEAVPEKKAAPSLKDDIKKNAEIDKPNTDSLWSQVQSKLKEYNFTAVDPKNLPSFEVISKKFGTMPDDKKAEAYEDLKKLNHSYHYDVQPAAKGSQETFAGSTHVKPILARLIDAEGKKADAIQNHIPNPFAGQLIAKVKSEQERTELVAKAKELIKTDKKFSVYIASFPKNVITKYLAQILKDWENGFEIPQEYRDDEDWVKMSYKMFDPHGDKKSLQSHRVADMRATREAREKVKLKELKSKSSEDQPVEKVSGLKMKKLSGEAAEEQDADEALKDIQKSKIGHVSATRKGTASIYDNFGYPKENKDNPVIERQIKDLVAKAAAEVPLLSDGDVVREQKQRKVLQYAEKILSLKKVHIFSTADGVKAKMPSNDDELYPLAVALKSFKEGKDQGDFRKLILSIKRIGTHSPEAVRNNAVKRIDDEMNVGLTELNALAKEDNVDRLKEIAKDVIKMYDYNKSTKPSLMEFRKRFGADDNTFEAYSNIDFLYKVVYGLIKDASAADIKNRIVAIKKAGLGNLIDMKAAGEKPARAMDTWMRDNKALSDKLSR